MLTQIKPRPEIDTSRVADIRSQLDQDIYDVDPREIADKFIDLEVALYYPN